LPRPGCFPCWQRQTRRGGRASAGAGRCAPAANFFALERGRALHPVRSRPRVRSRRDDKRSCGGDRGASRSARRWRLSAAWTLVGLQLLRRKSVGVPLKTRRWPRSSGGFYKAPREIRARRAANLHGYGRRRSPRGASRNEPAYPPLSFERLNAFGLPGLSPALQAEPLSRAAPSLESPRPCRAASMSLIHPTPAAMGYVGASSFRAPCLRGGAGFRRSPALGPPSHGFQQTSWFGRPARRRYRASEVAAVGLAAPRPGREYAIARAVPDSRQMSAARSPSQQLLRPGRLGTGSNHATPYRYRGGSAVCSFDAGPRPPPRRPSKKRPHPAPAPPAAEAFPLFLCPSARRPRAASVAETV